MINVGFIGCGAMGRDHVRRITDKCGNAQVVGVYDTVLGNAKQAIEDNRLDATIYDSADALIDDPNVDAVVIASRNDVHLDPLLHTIAIGKPTFTEKPMTINGSDSWKVVEAEVAKGRKTIQVGFNWRFDPGYDAMKTFVGGGQIGALLMAGMRHYNAQASTSYYGTDNVINDTLIHNFDMLHYMFDGDITSVEMKFARMNTLNPNGESLREPQLAIVEFSDGALATAEANVNCQYGYDTPYRPARRAASRTSNAAWSASPASSRCRMSPRRRCARPVRSATRSRPPGSTDSSRHTTASSTGSSRISRPTGSRAARRRPHGTAMWRTWLPTPRWTACTTAGASP